MFAADHPDSLPVSDMSLASQEQSKSGSKVGFSNDEPEKAAQTWGKPLLVNEQRKPVMKTKNTLCYGTTWNASMETCSSSHVVQLPSTHHARGLRHGHLRETLSNLYQGAEFSLFHGPLEASPLYWCLSRPMDSLDASFLKHDIGIRWKFISFWAASYKLNILSAAAEVVVGREAPVDSPCFKSSINATTHRKICKKHLASFLGSCLLRNEDMSEAERSSPIWCWRRTM